jgi:hypothetical protein
LTAENVLRDVTTTGTPLLFAMLITISLGCKPPVKRRHLVEVSGVVNNFMSVNHDKILN